MERWVQIWNLGGLYSKIFVKGARDIYHQDNKKKKHGIVFLLKTIKKQIENKWPF